jgi:hypothetical protein
MLSAYAASITSALDPASSITVLLVNLPGSSLLTNSNKNRELPLLAHSCRLDTQTPGEQLRHALKVLLKDFVVTGGQPVLNRRKGLSR